MAGYDPYAAREGQIARQQRMADLLGQQATEPIQQFGYDGIPAPISPFAGLAKGLQAWGSNRKNKAAEKGAADLNAQRGADTQADYSDLAAALARRSTEAVQPVSDETGTITHPYQRATPGGVNFRDIAQMRTPEGRQAGMADINQGQQFGQQMTLEQMRIAAQQVPSGYQRGPDGSLQPMTGGPADEATIKRNADAARDPLMLQQSFNPATQSMQTIAVPRAQALAAAQNGEGAVVGQGAPNEQVQRNAKLAVEGQNAAKAAASAIINPDGTVNRAAIDTLAVNFPGSQGRQARAQFDTALANLVYIKSGAQAGPAEIASARAQYMPSPLDDDKTIRDKMVRLAGFFAQSIPSGQPQPAAPPPPPATPSPAGGGGYTVRRIN